MKDRDEILEEFHENVRQLATMYDGVVLAVAEFVKKSSRGKKVKRKEIEDLLDGGIHNVPQQTKDYVISEIQRTQNELFKL